jgi:predicted secreted protein
MKKLVFLDLALVILLPLITTGCGSAAPIIIQHSLDDFRSQQTIYDTVDISIGESFTVILGSNPSTGYSWGDAAIWLKTAKIEQISHNYTAPTNTSLVGAGGTDVWVFQGKSAGSSFIEIDYGQSWAGGIKNACHMSITVNVK